jgi:uncharacterized RDD family membrane protein YckC
MMNMFKFLKKKQDTDQKLYPSFRARLFASLVDLALASFILIPMVTMGSSLIYREDMPSKRWSIIMSKASKEAGSFGSVSQKLDYDVEYKKFIEEGGYRGIFIEQMIQMSLLAVAIFIFWLKKSATPGKMFLSMKILDYKTLKEASSFQLIVRLCAYLVSFLPFGLGIFYIAFNKKHRGWHDIISRTIVVNTKELERQALKAKAN